MNTSNERRIRPAGWLAIVVLAALVIGALGALIRPLTAQPLPASEVFGTIVQWTPTPERRKPTAMPPPEGWSMKKDVTGKEHLAPPTDVEMQIIEAFNAVIACYYVEDADDAILLQQPDRKTLCERARQHGTPDYAASISLEGNMREIDTFGPINPVHCTDTDTCTVARAKLEVKGAIMYGDICSQNVQSSTCLVRAGISGLEPYQLHIATIERQENGTWKVVGWTTEQLPEPPSSR